MSEPTEMVLRVAEVLGPDRYDETVTNEELARAAIRAMLPNLETMDGHVMNQICAAFDWPQEFGRFPARDGLTASCTRAITAYISSALGEE